MGDPLSVQDGSDGYQSLEHRIVEHERDKDREVPKSIRLARWQEMQIRQINKTIGSNTVSVCLSAYVMGLSRIREEIGEDVQDIVDMMVTFNENVANSEEEARGDNQRLREVQDVILSTEIEIDEDYNLGEARKIRLKDSVISESSKVEEDALFGPWIHRAMIGIGFLSSENLNKQTEREAKEIIEKVNNSVERSREELERSICDFIKINFPKWDLDGISDGLYDGIVAITETMDTEYKRECERVVEILEDE